MNWDAFWFILVTTAGVSGVAFLGLWLVRPRSPKHYAIARTGVYCICRCGYHNAWDYDLRKHIEAWEETK